MLIATHFVKVEDQVELAYVPKIPIEAFHEVMDGLQA